MNEQMNEDKKDDALIDRLKNTEIGGWTLEKYLGKGASAVVFKGRRSNQVAAIKVYKPDMVNKFGENNEIDRINRQTKLIGTKYPYLISIFDGGRDSKHGDLYLVMEYLEGTSLDQWRKEVPRRPNRPSYCPNRRSNTKSRICPSYDPMWSHRSWTSRRSVCKKTGISA